MFSALSNLAPLRGGQGLGDLATEARVGIDAGPDRRAAQRQASQALERVVDTLLRRTQLRRPRAELLTKGERHRVHQMRATGLDDLIKRFGALVDGLAQMLERRLQMFLHRQQCRHANGGGDHIVGTLAQIDVVVGMHRILAGTRGQGGNHLIGIHVGRGARTGLVHIDGKLRIEAALGHLQCSGLHGLADRLRQQSKLGVDAGCRGLDQAQRANETARHRLPGHREILHRALGLRAPQRVGGHLQFAHAVVFGPETFAHLHSPHIADLW